MPASNITCTRLNPDRPTTSRATRSALPTQAASSRPRHTTPWGCELSETPPAESATQYSYDGLGDRTQILNPTTTDGTSETDQTFDLAGHLLKSTVDPTGADSVTTYAYDALERQATETDPSSEVTTLTYDGVGRTIRSVAGSAITDTTYDRAGEKLTVSDPYLSGATPIVTASAYDAAGNQCRSLVDATISPTTLAHPCTDAISSDGVHNLSTITYYDPAGNALATVDPTGVVTTNTYDVQGHLSKTIANCTDASAPLVPSSNPPACVGVTPPPDNKTDIVTTNSYSLVSGAKVSSTTTAGTLATTTDYDGAGRTISTIVDLGSGHLNLETDYAYDADGRQIATKSPTGEVTVTVYYASGQNGAGQVYQTITNCSDLNPGALPGSSWATCKGSGAADGTWNQTTTYTYDDAGNKSQMTAPNGQVTAYTYDDQNRLSEQDIKGSGTTPDDITLYYYDADGHKTATAAENDSGSYVVTRDIYDATTGYLDEEISNCTDTGTTPSANPVACVGAGTHDGATNIVTSYTYDASGNKTSMTAPSPSGSGTELTLYAYDGAQRLCRVIASASADIILANSTCTSAISASSATVNVETRYDYTATGALAHQYAPLSPGQSGQQIPGAPSWSSNYAVTTYSYDAEGRLSSTTDADSSATTYGYDANGNKASETDQDGQQIHWYYDSADRLCGRAALPAGVSYSPPANPCTSAVSGATVDTFYAHDHDGTLTGATDALSGQAISVTLDSTERPLAVADTGGSTAVGDNGGAIADPGTTYTYGYAVATRTDDSGAYSFTLDSYGREASVDPLSHPDGDNFAWAYGPSGKLDTLTEPTGTANGATGDNVTSYSYDALDRLAAETTAAKVSGTNTIRTAYTYAYNAASYITSETASLAGSAANGTTSYTYDALGRIASFTPPAALSGQSYTWNAMPDRASITTGSSSTTVAYDNADRPISDSSGDSYTTDGEGRITALPGQTLVYDAAGRLSSVKTSSDGSTIAAYTYDPLDRLESVTEVGVTTNFLYVGLTNVVASQSSTAGSVTTVTNHVTDHTGSELYEIQLRHLCPCLHRPGGCPEVRGI